MTLDIANRAGVTLRVPTGWHVLRNSLARLAGRPTCPPPLSAHRDPALSDAALALRRGCAEDAAILLAPHQAALERDPEYLNLLGVVCEQRQHWKAARRFYGAAISIAPDFTPAQQNMRRIFELSTFGRSLEHAALLTPGRPVPHQRLGVPSGPAL